MLFADRTNEFREAVKARPARTGDAKQGSSGQQRKGKQRDIWMQEADKVNANILALANFLQLIRRPYLDSSNRGSLKASGKSNVDLSGLQHIKHLSEREKDEIDVQVKSNLKKCMHQIKELEQAEKIRQEYLASQQPPHLALPRFLRPSTSTSLPADPAQAQTISIRSSIIYYLNHQLASAGRASQQAQEIRVKKQMDRHSALGSSPSTLGKEWGEQMASQHRSSGNSKSTTNNPDDIPSIFIPESEDEPIESLLTPAQIQQFEAESSSLLQETQNQLAALQAAQSSLLEISALQSELVVHLTQQSELTDILWEDAQFVSGRVDEGNKQLKKAKERNKDSRIYLLAFLVGASLTLLFLDQY